MDKGEWKLISDCKIPIFTLILPRLWSLLFWTTKVNFSEFIWNCFIFLEQLFLPQNQKRSIQWKNLPQNVLQKFFLIQCITISASAVNAHLPSQWIVGRSYSGNWAEGISRQCRSWWNVVRNFMQYIPHQKVVEYYVHCTTQCCVHTFLVVIRPHNTVLNLQQVLVQQVLWVFLWIVILFW